MRANGFAVAPEQTTAFLAAIALLGPRDIEDVRRAGLATLAPPPERHGAFDALFHIHFLGDEVARAEGGEDEDIVRVQEERRGEDEPPLADETNECGRSGGARGSARRAPLRAGAAATTPCAGSPARRRARLPRRRSYRRMRARRGRIADLRRTLRDSARNDGEVLRLRAAEAPHASTQAPAADRRLRLDEGAHRGEPAPGACARRRRARASRSSPSARA